MIIVEGPDGAGKSTLVKELKEEFGIAYLLDGERGTDNRDELWKHTREDTYKALRLALTPGEDPRIWDRLFWSEFVYHPLTSRKCQFSPHDSSLIPSLIAALKAPVILCLPSFDVVEANAEKSHQMEGVNENLGNIYEGYKRMLANEMFPIGLNLMHYDYTAPTAREAKFGIFGRVQAWLEEAHVR